MEICAQAVIDFLGASNFRKFPSRQVEEREQVHRREAMGGQLEREQEERE